LSLRHKPVAFAFTAPAKYLSVFKQPRVATDALPRDSYGRRVISHLYDDAIKWDALHRKPPWRILESRSRLLVADPKAGLSVYAAPMTDNGVCYEVPEVGGRCLSDSFPVAAQSGRHWDNNISPLTGRCYPLSVVGLVPDDVATVTVVVAGHEQAATLGRNAFLYVADAKSLKASDVSTVIVHYRDGGRVVTHLG
jgi:hypothetical protein